MIKIQKFLFWKYLMDYVIRSFDFLKMKMGSAYVSRSYNLPKKEN